ncbi:MAG: hypothetical protein ACOX87_11855 [Chloroflexota bacterium]
MIYQHECKLKLRDDDPKTLGRSHIQYGTVVCDDPALVEGVDYEIDYEVGTIRRLVDLGDGYERKLIGFSFEYDDRSDLPEPPSFETRLAALEAIERERILEVL